MSVQPTLLQQVLSCPLKGRLLYCQVTRHFCKCHSIRHNLNSTAVTSSLRSLVPCQAANSSFMVAVISSKLDSMCSMSEVTSSSFPCIRCKAMCNTTNLLNLNQKRLQFIKGSAGDTNSKTFPRQSLGHCATSSISSTYDQADFCVYMMKSLMN